MSPILAMGPGFGSSRTPNAATSGPGARSAREPSNAASDPRTPPPDFLTGLLAAMAAPEKFFGDPAERSVDPGASNPLEGADTETAPEEVASATDPGRAEAAEAAAAPRPALGAMEGVHPELVARVERVADRMWSEFGHRVEVVEGHRSQHRQDQLYAQGRTAPGPQVTWTRNSAHTRGEAVDVRIDGGWENTRAFERLQQVAREEGIRTLGMRDAGHLELPRGAGHPGAGAGGASHGIHGEALTRTPGQIQGHAQFPGAAGAGAGAAEPLSRSGVAGVAQVANVARVARPGNAGGHASGHAGGNAGGRGSTAGAADVRGAVPARTAHHQVALEPSGFLPNLGRAPGELQGEAGRANGDGAREADASVPFIELASTGSESGGASLATSLRGSDAFSMAELALQSLGGAREGAGLLPLVGAGGVAGGVPGAEALLRAEQIRAIQAAAGPRANLSMELSNVDGAGTDLHLAMRGRDVSARIDAVDPLQARAMRLRLGELRSTLSERGLEAERLGVRLLQSEPLVLVREGERGGEAGRQEGERAPGDDGGREHTPGRERDDASNRGGARHGEPGFHQGFQEHYERETR